VRIDVQIALRLHIEINHSVPRHLLEHVIQERHPGSKTALTGAIEIQAHRNTCFQGISGYFCQPHDVVCLFDYLGFRLPIAQPGSIVSAP
jgi:hypothetical protein